MLILVLVNFGIAILAWECGWTPRPVPPPSADEFARTVELLSCEQRSALLVRVFSGELARDSLLDSVVAAAFNQRRKMLRASLKGVAPDIEDRLMTAGIQPTERAEQVPLEAFCALAREIKPV